MRKDIPTGFTATLTVVSCGLIEKARFDPVYYILSSKCGQNKAEQPAYHIGARFPKHAREIGRKK